MPCGGGISRLGTLDARGFWAPAGVTFYADSGQFGIGSERPARTGCGDPAARAASSCVGAGWRARDPARCRIPGAWPAGALPDLNAVVESRDGCGVRADVGWHATGGRVGGMGNAPVVVRTHPLYHPAASPPARPRWGVGALVAPCAALPRRSAPGLGACRLAIITAAELHRHFDPVKRHGTKYLSVLR